MGVKTYAIFIIVLLIWNALIFITPILAFDDNPLAGTLYDQGFSWACHQKISRSLCLFKGENGYFIADCTMQAGEYVNDARTQIGTINEQGLLGYKFPVCSRDIAIYLAMLLGALAYPFFLKFDQKEVPDPLYLVIALIPIGIDGGLQLLFDSLGISLPIIGGYESTNFKRVVTGFIAGIVLPFYILPIVNNIISKKQDSKTNPKKYTLRKDKYANHK